MKYISHGNAIGFVYCHQNTHHITYEYIFKTLFILVSYNKNLQVALLDSLLSNNLNNKNDATTCFVH